MRFLPTRVHGVIDYLWGIALIATPWMFGYGGAAQWVAIAFGAGAVLYSLVTVYELGAVRIIPMSMHLALDGIAGAVLAASPWLFGFAGEVFWPHLLFGLFSVAASLVTKPGPTCIRSWSTPYNPLPNGRGPTRGSSGVRAMPASSEARQSFPPYPGASGPHPGCFASDPLPSGRGRRAHSTTRR